MTVQGKILMSEMAFQVEMSVPYEQAIDRVTDALKAEGFGVLTRIDVHDTLKAKINVDFRPYSILGACNPGLAHKALSARPDVGLMLPCNVVVEQSEQGSLVRILDPAAMMQAGGFESDETLKAVGGEAEKRLRRVAAALA